MMNSSSGEALALLRAAALWKQGHSHKAGRLGYSCRAVSLKQVSSSYVQKRRLRQFTCVPKQPGDLFRRSVTCSGCALYLPTRSTPLQRELGHSSSEDG